MRRAKRLVQIEVHHVDAQIAKAGLAEHRVHVRAVAVHQATAGMDRLDDLGEVLVEQAKCAWNRDHQRRDVRSERGTERLQVQVPPVVRRNRLHGVANHLGRGRVGPVGGIGNEHALALVVATLFVVGPNDEHPGELAVRASRRLERNRRHPADLGEVPLKLIHQA